MPIAAATAAVNFHPTTTRYSGTFASPPSSPFRTSVSISNAVNTTTARVTSLSLSMNSRPNFTASRRTFLLLSFAASGGSGGDDNFNGGNGGSSGNGGGGGGGGGDNEESGDQKNNKKEALMALTEAGRSLESLPKDMKAAIEDGRIPGSIVLRFFELEKSPLFAWLLQFGGFRERLLADDLFLAKVAMECGVGIFTKTAAEYERRRENFFNELEIVVADVVMAVIADFMLVYLPAPTVSLRPRMAVDAGRIANFFYNCPDNAFQMALPGTSYSLLQRLGAIARNGSKLFAVGTASSLVGTVVTNAVLNAKKAVDKSEEVETLPVLSTSVAYGVYMAVSSNLRYQVVAGVIEQRILEPMLHQHKLLLSAMCFAVRTGNTFLGSLLWVDYARLIGIQKAHDEVPIQKAQEVES
ncbi:protein RETICULATA-RELATED 4, chloroplastic [Nicotiana tabacum]|uniref:Protein RETICULATA-RELATED 4, chloroplastic n=2 Tax=Nicotiana tabacum TaxID=4097 RepID=A0AC58RZR0_TOBAC|nr:PREDICTED: protein RETICULATA-RELATED 4, chloroplastic-like [Nicotiana tabacum]